MPKIVGTWSRSIALLMAIIGLGAGVGSATGMEFAKQTTAGQKVLLYRFYDCRRHNPGGDGGAFAAHGTVRVQVAYLNVCGNAREPARLAWYTSNAGFKGVDRVTFPLGPQTLNFNVTVH